MYPRMYCAARNSACLAFVTTPRSATVERMTIQRMDHVGIVVDDLAAATAFFVELGLEPQGQGQVRASG